MIKKNCLVLHRKSANQPEVETAIKAVIKSGIPLRVCIPWTKKDMDLVVREAIESGAERIIAGGGDGTINALVNCLVRSGKKTPQTVMGILPLGTANDFARGCQLPLDDLEECLRIACMAPARAVDVGRMNKHCFINVASLGFGAEVTATTPPSLKKLLGGAAYTLMGLASAFQFEPYNGRLLIPGQAAIEGQLLVAAVGNGKFAGSGFNVAPRASLTDGLLDFSVIRHDAEFSISTVLSELDDPFHEENRYVRYWQIPEFTIVSDEKLHCNLDGEPIQKRKMKFSVLSQHLRVALPGI